MAYHRFLAHVLGLRRNGFTITRLENARFLLGECVKRMPTISKPKKNVCRLVKGSKVISFFSCTINIHLKIIMLSAPLNSE